MFKHLPNGDIRLDLQKLISPTRGRAKTKMEEIIEHFKLHTEGLVVNAGTVYSCVEAPKGEFGFFIASKGGSLPFRCRIRPPGLYHLMGIDKLCEGHYLADVVTILGSQDIVFGEVDR